MERKQIPILVRALILSILLVSPMAQAQDGGEQSPVATDGSLATAASEPIGTGFTYQGKLEQGGSPVNDDCDMVFRLFDQQIGGTQIGSSITETVPIVDGLFTVNLGFGANAFNGERRWLKITVDCEEDGIYTALGRKELTAAPYALYASYAAKSGGPQNVVTVAQSGGDYSSIQAAIDSITDATAANPYLVWVAPGVYSETVTMKPYVDLQGAGQRATIINSTVTNDSSSPSQATVVLTHTASVRDLMVRNDGTGSYNVALLAMDGTHHALVADVIVRARGSGTGNYAIHLAGSGTDVTLMHVTAVAENGSFENYGLYNHDGAEATLHSGSFTGRGGTHARGIKNHGIGTTLEATDVTALGESGDDNFGLYSCCTAEATATLHGGSFTGRGGDDAVGIYSGGATLEATGITALAENGISPNYGLLNAGTGTAEIDGSRLIGSDYGLIVNSGTVRLAVTQLDGGARNDSGTLTCFQVYDGSYGAYSCP